MLRALFFMQWQLVIVFISLQVNEPIVLWDFCSRSGITEHSSLLGRETVMLGQ